MAIRYHVVRWRFIPNSSRNPVRYHYQNYPGLQNLTEVPVTSVTWGMPNLMWPQRWAVYIRLLSSKVRYGKIWPLITGLNITFGTVPARNLAETHPPWPVIAGHIAVSGVPASSTLLPSHWSCKQVENVRGDDTVRKKRPSAFDKQKRRASAPSAWSHSSE